MSEDIVSCNTVPKRICSLFHPISLTAYRLKMQLYESRLTPPAAEYTNKNYCSTYLTKPS
jgi:hypothetical protein